MGGGGEGLYVGVCRDQEKEGSRSLTVQKCVIIFKYGPHCNS